MVQRLLRRLGLGRGPAVGDIYWLPDAVIGIITSAEAHPALIVGRSKFSGGPVRIAPGSSSRPDEPGTPVIRVSPNDLAPTGCLTKAETRFYLADSHRIDAVRLGRRIGALNASKLADLKKLRGIGL